MRFKMPWMFLLLLHLYIPCMFALKVGITDDIGPFENYDQECTLEPDLFASETQEQLSLAFEEKGIQSAWIPVQRENLTNWVWLSGEKFAKTITNPATVIHGHDCALLLGSEQMIIDSECSRQLKQYICESNYPCSQNLEQLRCFEINGKAYRIYAKESTWFQAKEACYQKNSTLGSFEKEYFERILQVISETGALNDRIWIGLRLTDYFYQMPGKRKKETLNSFKWGKGPCACPDKMCTIIAKNTTKALSWVAENCSASHPYVCGISDHGNEGQFAKFKRTAIVSSVTSFLLVILIVAVVFFYYKRQRKKKRSDDTEDTREFLEKKAEAELSKKAIEIRNSKMKATNPVKSEPNILLIGLPGAGKSSLINSLRMALTPGGYQALAQPGNFGGAGKAVTYFLKKYPLFTEEIEPDFTCWPVLWDCPGFQNDISKEEKIRSIIRGEVSTDEPIAAKDSQGKFSTGEVSTKEPIAGKDIQKKIEKSSTKCAKMDLVIFVHGADDRNAPTNLATAAANAAKFESKRILLVITKRDLVKSEDEDIITDELSKILGIYKEVHWIVKLSCYHSKSNKQAEITRDSKTDRYMCNLWEKLLSWTHYTGR